jgi:hypothetical protein
LHFFFFAKVKLGIVRRISRSKMLLIFILFLLNGLSTLTQGYKVGPGNAEDCWTTGACLQSVMVNQIVADDPLTCEASCQASPDCVWFTHYGNTLYSSMSHYINIYRERAFLETLEFLEIFGNFGKIWKFWSFLDIFRHFLEILENF